MAEEEVFGEVESLMRQWRLEEATVLLERRLGEPGVPPRIHHDLSVLYAQQGLFDDALGAIDKAMALDPANRAVWHHYLALQKNNPEQPTDAAWKSMHLQFGDTLRERFDARHLAVARARDPDARLRIGYLGPDTHNATERFVGPVLDRFERPAFEVFAYWNHARSLAHGARYQDALHRSIEGLASEDIVELVLRDRIDILVDIAGHGAGNALPALARRPAPIQMTWLDYLATTGLESVDYRITDGAADPAGAEARHVESLLRLAVPQWCYRPPDEAPRAARGEARAGDAIIFGAISVPLKLSATILELWARLLARVPGARIRFLGIPPGRARARIELTFARAGIAKERLDIRGRLGLGEFLGELADIDVVLDTYPFNGATATLDALWQGVPVASLAGRLTHSRSGASILGALGKPQWVAHSEDEYLAIAAALAQQARRATLERGELRAELAASALCDGEGFVRALEGAYRESWRDWLARTRSIDAARPHANARADVLLAGAGEGAQRCRDLLDTLPAHRIAGQVFWSEFRAGGDEAADARRVAPGEIGDAWVALTAAAHYASALAQATLPADALAQCDALAAFGADAMPHGDLLAAGRGHVGGILAHVENDAVHVRLWVPQRMNACAVLSGPVLFVRRSIVEARRFPQAAFADEAEFARAVSRYTFELHRDGARLGIASGLAVPARAVIDAARQFASARALAEETGTEAVPQTEVAASALKAIVPAAAWPAFLRRAERFCDRYRAEREVSLPCA